MSRIKPSLLTSPAELKELCLKYRMSVSEAKAVICPCGMSAGKQMGDVGYRELYWFAHRNTSASHTKEFRKAVTAARIIRAWHGTQRWNRSDHAPTFEPDAKSASVSCNDCGATIVVHRSKLDRRSFRCADCGGTMQEDPGRILDEMITLREASYLSGRSADFIRKRIMRGALYGMKTNGRWMVGLSALENLIEELKSQAEAATAVVDDRRHRCPGCTRRFRNYYALCLHVKETHPGIKVEDNSLINVKRR